MQKLHFIVATVDPLSKTQLTISDDLRWPQSIEYPLTAGTNRSHRTGPLIAVKSSSLGRQKKEAVIHNGISFSNGVLLLVIRLLVGADRPTAKGDDAAFAPAGLGS